jgi:hypothetical protein
MRRKVLLSRFTVLVVDDETPIRANVAAILSPMGLRVLVAEDGFKALGLLDEAIDLAIVDTPNAGYAWAGPGPGPPDPAGSDPDPAARAPGAGRAAVEGHRLAAGARGSEALYPRRAGREGARPCMGP